MQGVDEDLDMATAAARRRRTIRRLLATDFARDRLSRALFEIAADGLNIGPVAVRTPADRACVRDVLSGPIQRTAEDAVERLAVELTQAMAALPEPLAERILAARLTLEDVVSVRSGLVLGSPWITVAASFEGPTDEPQDSMPSTLPVVPGLLETESVDLR